MVNVLDRFQNREQREATTFADSKACRTRIPTDVEHPWADGTVLADLM